MRLFLCFVYTETLKLFEVFKLIENSCEKHVELKIDNRCTGHIKGSLMYTAFIYHLKFTIHCLFLNIKYETVFLCPCCRKIAEFLCYFFLELRINYTHRTKFCVFNNELLFTNQTFQIDVYDETIF